MCFCEWLGRLKCRSRVTITNKLTESLWALIWDLAMLTFLSASSSNNFSTNLTARKLNYAATFQPRQPFSKTHVRNSKHSVHPQPAPQLSQQTRGKNHISVKNFKKSLSYFSTIPPLLIFFRNHSSFHTNGIKT